MSAALKREHWQKTKRRRRQGAVGRAEIHPASVDEESLPEESPLTRELEVAAWPYDPLEGPVDPRNGRPAPAGAGTAGGHGPCRATAAHRDCSRLALARRRRLPRSRAGSSAPQAAGWAQGSRTCFWSAVPGGRRSRDVHLPGHISASTLVDLGEDAEAVVQRLRRPVPREPGMSARKGTAFHAWVEEYFGTAGMLDLGEAPGSDNHIDEAYGLEDMVATFKDSEWAHRSPAYVEVPVETRIGDVVVRGRIDAVFRDADGGWDLVDWKTGRRPSAGQLKTKSVQLAVYRLAWARLKGVPLEDVRAAFYLRRGQPRGAPPRPGVRRRAGRDRGRRTGRLGSTGRLGTSGQPGTLAGRNPTSQCASPSQGVVASTIVRATVEVSAPVR